MILLFSKLFSKLARLFWILVGLLTGSITIGRLRKIPIQITGALVAFLAISLTLSIGNSVYICGICIVYPSLLLHELGHAFVAQRAGSTVSSIRLDIIGGSAIMEIPRYWRDELMMAIAGPLVSIVLAVALFNIYGTCHAMVIGQAGMINVVIAAFNLLPGFPMDGGRILRALLQRRMGRSRATEVAIKVARVIFILFIMAGVFYRYWLIVLIALLLWFYGVMELHAMHDEVTRDA